MRELSVREMRAGHCAIAEALEADGEVVLTHHGKPFARVVPLAPAVVLPVDAESEQRKRARAWVAKQRRFLAGQPELSPFDWDALRADR